MEHVLEAVILSILVGLMLIPHSVDQMFMIYRDKMGE